MANGKITQVIGTVVDVEFPPEEMPSIFNALETEIAGDKLVLEVEQHVGNSWARCLALGPTEGLIRGVDVVDTGSRSLFPSETRRSAASLIASARLWTTWRRSMAASPGPFTATRPASRSRRPRSRFSRPA